MILDGIIERRLHVNYRVEPDVIARVLPAPFRPRVVYGAAVVGVCLIRLGSVRPHGLPEWMGMRSENAAHRIAVEFDTQAGPGHGVYIPRRDSGAWLNTVVGGRLFPGEHHHARFRVDESPTAMHVTLAADDGSAEVDVRVAITTEFPGSALFASVDDASEFFRRDPHGWSATRDPNRFDGLELRTTTWKLEPTRIEHVSSTFFDDQVAFPPGTVDLDSVFLMRDIVAQWIPIPAACAPQDRLDDRYCHER